MHILKVIILTGIFGLLTSHISMASPIAQVQTPPQRTKQIKQKKHNFVERTFKHFKNDKKSINKARLGLILGALSLPLLIPGTFILPMLFRLSLGFALIAVLLGIKGLKKYPKNTENRRFSRIGLILGAITLGIFILFISVYVIGLYVADPYP